MFFPGTGQCSMDFNGSHIWSLYNHGQMAHLRGWIGSNLLENSLFSRLTSWQNERSVPRKSR